MPLLPPFSQPGRFWRGNLHCHSQLSDGAKTADAVVEAYKAAGYDFMMLSDHFLGRFNWPIADTCKHRSNSFTTLLGAELHAPATSAGELWHIVAAGLPPDFAPAGETETGPELALRARAAGAFVGMAHPAWSLLGINDGLALEAAHAVEIYNHGCAVDYERGDGWFLLDRLLNSGRRLTGFAADDAHFKSKDQFGGWVHVKADSLSPDALLAALKDGHYYASQGPLIHAIAMDGHQIHVTCSPVDTIVVMTGYSKTVRRVGSAITEATLDLSKLRRTGTDPHSAWFRVAVIEQAGKRAWSNPYWWHEIG